MNIKAQKSKIVRVTILQANLDFISSVSIGDDLVEGPNFIEFEKVQSVNINKGEMLKTFVIHDERESEVISPNGSSARKVRIGGLDSIVSFAKRESEEAKKHKLSIVFPIPQNKLN